MTGPEHYEAAEELLAWSAAHQGSSDAAVMGAIGTAQVHATLALVAATAMPQVSRQEWLQTVYAANFIDLKGASS